MQKIWPFCIFVFFIYPHHANAFAFSLRPYLGYARVNMSEVDENNRYGINSLSNLVSQPLPFPEPFNGHLMGGIQIEYHYESQYYLYFSTYYFRESSTVNYENLLTNSTLTFFNDRSIELFEFSLGLKYFLKYSSWRPINFYLSGGAGFALGGARSEFVYHDGKNSVDNKGNFNSSSLTAHFCAGVQFRFSHLFSLEAEAGYRQANLQQMEGVLEVQQNFPDIPDGKITARDDNYRTDANYDFSGFFFNLGIGLYFQL